MDETGDDAPARTDPEADAVPKIASPTPAANADAPRSPAPGASEQAQPSAETETETDEEASGGEHGHGHGGPVHGKRLLSLSLLALGVVYGDIGTSPLYAIRECLHGEHHMALTEANIMGVLSLIVWSLTVVISLKYLVYVLRADNQGEGGILALMALALSQPVKSALRTAIVMLGLFGAALLYGDGVITPAISVLSAVEGLGVAAPGLKTYIVPITIAILIGLFWIQKRGTALVGALFGPVTLLWFSVLALLGLVHIAQLPKVLWALSPTYAVSFFLNNGSDGILVLGGVFLAVTGGEALYADMGHFGVKPIRLTWFGLVFPALIINYFGQGALLLRDPSVIENVFFHMAPQWALYPMVILATMATIIASQAVISGAFSLTRQASMLGYFPRVKIEHTSPDQIGQIYVPLVNWGLLLATLALVVSFGSSSRLASAYGIAVSTTMIITVALAYVVARQMWRWSLWACLAITVPLLAIDLTFFGANIAKVMDGGWIPLGIALLLLVLMTTWKKGRSILGTIFRERLVPLEDLYELLTIERPARVPGTALFLTSNAQGTPSALMQNFLLNRVLHKQVVLLTIVTEEMSHVDDDKRVVVERLEHGFVRIIARYGFMEDPDVPALLAREDTPTPPIDHTTFFLGRETIISLGRHGMSPWRSAVFAFMSRNAARATAFFNIPSSRVIEIGTQIEL